MQTGANAGRFLCSYLNGKPFLMSDETAKLANTCFTICTDHFRMHQSFQMVWEIQVSTQPRQPCCHHQDGCVTLPAPTPPQTCHVLCSSSLGASGAAGHFCDLIINHYTGIYSLFSCSVSSGMQLSSHEEEDGACRQGQRLEERKAAGPPSFSGDELLDQLLYSTYH